MSERNSLISMVKGVLISTVGKTCGRMIYLLTQILLARFLGPVEFGLYAIGWTVIRMVGMLSILGLDYGIIRFGSSYWRTDKIRFRSSIQQAFGIVMLSGLLSAGILFFFSHKISLWFEDDALIAVIQLAAIGLFFFIVFRLVVSTTIISQQMIYPIGLEEFVQPLTNLSCVALFVWFGWGVKGAIGALILSLIIAIAWGLWEISILYPEVFRARSTRPLIIRPLLSFSVPTALASLFSFYLFWVDRLMVGFFLGSKAAGLYQAVSQISLLFATILASMNTVFVPMIAELLDSKEYQRLETLFRISTKWGLYTSMPLAVIFVLIPQTFLYVIFGADYVGGYWALRILTVAQLVNVATGAINLLLLMGSYHKYWLAVSALMFAIHIGVSYFLIPKHGMIGAAVGTTVALSGLYGLGLFRAKQKLSMWPYDRRYLKGLAAAIIAFIGGLILRSQSFPSEIFEVVIVSVGVGVIFLFVLLLSGLDEEDRAFVNMLKFQLKSKTNI